MKKYRLLGALLAGVLAVTGVPAVTQPLTVSVSAASKLAAPKNVKAVSSGTSAIKVTWSKVSGASAYRVYKYNSATEKYETYKNVAGTSCTVKNLVSGATYKFRVAALVKKNGKYVVQTVSSAVSAKVNKKTTSTTSSSSSKLFEFPAYGSSVKSALSAVGITSEYGPFEIADDMVGYGGYKKINGTNSMVLLYFNGSSKFFYGAVLLDPGSVKYSKALSTLKSSLGSKYQTVNSDPNTLTFWVDGSNLYMLAGSDDSQSCMYFAMNYDMAPASVKSGNGDISSALDNISGLLA